MSAQVSTTVCTENKKNTVSPHLDTHCSSSVKKNENNKNNLKICCLLSTQQNFGNNFSVAWLVTICGCGILNNTEPSSWLS